MNRQVNTSRIARRAEEKKAEGDSAIDHSWTHSSAHRPEKYASLTVDTAKMPWNGRKAKQAARNTVTGAGTRFCTKQQTPAYMAARLASCTALYTAAPAVIEPPSALPRL